MDTLDPPTPRRLDQGHPLGGHAPHGTRRALLAVHAHPDDETILTGGTLAKYAADGVRTIVVTCTQGELGFPLPGEESTAATRAAELAGALRWLGVSRHVQLGYLDSGMPGAADNVRPGTFHMADLQTAAERVAEVIAAERPQVVLAYDQTGGYGHPDHVKAHHVSVEACRLAAVDKLYFVRLPLGWSREFVRSLRAAGIDAPGSAASGADAGRGDEEIGVPDELVTTSVDVRTFVDVKRAALECHASQIGPDHFLRRMPRDLAYRLWAYEFYSLENRQARLHESDLFEGLS